MLTPEQITALRDMSGQIVDPIVDYLIENIARRVAEAGQLTGTASYQVWKLQKLGVSQRQLKKGLRKRLKVSHRQLRQLLTQAAHTGYDFDIRRFPQVQSVPFAENTTLQQILDATIKLAQDDLSNVTQTIGFVAPNGKCMELTEAYQKTCDFAFQKVVTGAQDYVSAIRDATKNLAEKGIRTIDYDSGVHTSLEAAVRRNIMGGLGLMNEQITQQNHDDLGCDGWEISAHGGSAPDHEPIQGKQYSDTAFTRLNNSLVRRIGTLNCGHSAMPIILGVNEPQYTAQELEEFRRQNEAGIEYEGNHYTLYGAAQRQRSLERSIRNSKRKILIDESTDDAEKLQWDQIRLVRTREEYHRFSKAANLPEQFERMEKAGFTWKHGKAAEKAAKNCQNAKDTIAKANKSAIMNAEAKALPDRFRKFLPAKDRRLEIIEEGKTLDRPIFAGGLLGELARSIIPEPGYFDVVLHGTEYGLEYFTESIDVETLCAIIAQRKDYQKGMNIRLISCYTGAKEDGVAQYVADKLRVKVSAPNKQAIVSKTIKGETIVYSGSKIGVRDGEFIIFSPKEGGEE